MRAAIVLGTRPEIIKLAPVVKALEARGHKVLVIWTRQHERADMASDFFSYFGIKPQVEADLSVAGIQAAVDSWAADVVIVQGDTDSALAGALAGRHVSTVAHVEAGLRSGDLRMVEEKNRIAIDHMSEFLFAPTRQAAENLRLEDVTAYYDVVGNTVADALLESGIPDRPKERSYALLTLHRRESVDDPAQLRALLACVEELAEEHGLHVFFPAHPRTFDVMGRSKIATGSRIILSMPMGYHTFLATMRSARLVLTDSGGVQEEACILGVPCVTLREHTERPETVELGANKLAGYDPSAIAEAAACMIVRSRDWKQPYGDGHAAERIVRILEGQRS